MKPNLKRTIKTEEVMEKRITGTKGKGPPNHRELHLFIITEQPK